MEIGGESVVWSLEEDGERGTTEHTEDTEESGVRVDGIGYGR